MYPQKLYVKSTKPYTCMLSGYGLDDRGSFPGRGKDFFRHRVQTGSGAHLTSYPTDIGRWFLGDTAAGEREADHSPPSSTEVKNAWNYNPIPPHVLQGYFYFSGAIFKSSQMWSRSTYGRLQRHEQNLLKSADQVWRPTEHKINWQNGSREGLT
jgi:hypothetical protein